MINSLVTKVQEVQHAQQVFYLMHDVKKNQVAN